MRLKDLLKFDEIVIQCHDNPDADAIACDMRFFCIYRNMAKVHLWFMEEEISFEKPIWL